MNPLCPFCHKNIYISPQYILSDKPAWDLLCLNKECPVEVRLLEQRDLEKAKEIMLWHGNIRFSRSYKIFNNWVGVVDKHETP